MRHARFLVSLALLASPAFAREPEGPRGGPAEFPDLRYRLVGPAIGGRATRAAGLPGDPRTYYVAAASGGLWKSTDGGHGWKPLLDEQAIASVGSFAVAPTDPNVIYVGSGEANIRGNVAEGNGIYRSTDAGQTWKHVWVQQGQIGTIVVDPRNADVAFAAVLGKAFGPNPERGVYRTTDGGNTWKQVLKKDADTGASDVALDPSNPRVVFAGMWQARRRPWDLTSGGPGSSLFVSRDGGDTWKELTHEDGLPEGLWGKVGVAVAPSDPRRVYAIVEAEKGGLFRSDDGGRNWTLASDHRALRQRAWYYSTITVDPHDADQVWIPQVPLLKSIDGGKTFKQVKVPHGDNHDLWIDPKDTRRLVLASDGGGAISLDGGDSWMAAALPIAQFYHVAADDRVPYHVSGAMQDMGTAAAPSNSLQRGGISLAHWYDVGGGEAGHTAPVAKDPDVVWAGEYLGILSRFDRRTGQARNVSPWPDNLSGHGAEDGRYRFQWTAPIVTSRHDPRVVYYGGNVLFKTTDDGARWARISPDLTRDDKAKQKWSGGPITGDNTGVEHYGTIFALAESPHEAGLLWAGTDDGLVHFTRDGGANWTNVTAAIPGLPAWGTVACIEASPFDAATAYVVVDAHRIDDARPYLWRTTDFGKTWTSLAPGLAKDAQLHAVREDPVRRGLLFVGSERGVSFSRDAGKTWQELKLNLPTVPVHDLLVKGDDLVVGTHGRSIWILDDLSPIREWNEEIARKDVHLFAPRPAVRWRVGSSFHLRGTEENPPVGVTFHYWLKQESKAKAELQILDFKGRVVRTIRDTAEKPETEPGDPDGPWEPEEDTILDRKKGVHRVVWDLAWEGARPIPKAKVDTGDPRYGPLAIPGDYTARLSVGEATLTVPVKVLPDPRTGLSLAELSEAQTFGLQIRDDLTLIAELVEEARGLRQQLTARADLLAGRADASGWVAEARAAAKECEEFEGRLHNKDAQVTYDILAQRGGTQLHSRLAALFEFVKDADGAPTVGMIEVYLVHKKALRDLEEEWRDFVGDELPQLVEKAEQAKLPSLVLPKVRKLPSEEDEEREREEERRRERGEKPPRLN